MATRLKKLASRGIKPSQDNTDLILIEAYSRLEQLSNELNTSTLELRRLKTHLLEDLQLLEEAQASPTKKSFMGVIQKNRHP
jgi:hypothetical protein